MPTEILPTKNKVNSFYEVGPSGCAAISVLSVRPSLRRPPDVGSGPRTRCDKKLPTSFHRLFTYRRRVVRIKIIVSHETSDVLNRLVRVIFEFVQSARLYLVTETFGRTIRTLDIPFSVDVLVLLFKRKKEKWKWRLAEMFWSQFCVECLCGFLETTWVSNLDCQLGCLEGRPVI